MAESQNNPESKRIFDQEMVDFVTMWAPIQSGVWMYINSTVPDFHEAEDIMQRVAVVVVRKFDQYDANEGSFLGWVTGIVRFEILNWRRTKARGKLVFDEATLKVLSEVQPDVQDELMGMGDALGHCLSKTSQRNQALIAMRYQEGVKPAGIAERLGTSSESVRVMLHRVRCALRKCIEGRVRLDEVGP